MESGFVITASWPVNTAAEGSLHIKENAAAKSTIFLVCRPRETRAATGGVDYTGWGPEPGRVADEEVNFARIWANQARRFVVLDVPEAARRDLLKSSGG